MIRRLAHWWRIYRKRGAATLPIWPWVKWIVRGARMSRERDLAEALRYCVAALEWCVSEYMPPAESGVDSRSVDDCLVAACVAIVRAKEMEL